MNWKKLLIIVMSFVMCCSLGLCEEEEITLEDLFGADLDSTIEEEIIPADSENEKENADLSSDCPQWNFPLDLSDIDPDMIVLANKEMLLSKNFAPKPLMTMKTRKSASDGSNSNGGVRKATSGETSLQQQCGEALVAMFDAAESEDIILYLKSAYRSYRTQDVMYYNRLKKNNGKDDGYVAKPGASDHQTGLGCDVVSKEWKSKGMNEKFADTKEAQWMLENCADYGFVLRYPEDKEDITEIKFEPWHLRYVGVDVAHYIMDNGLCLEEFHNELQQAIDEYIADGGNKKAVEPYIQVSAEN